MTVVGFVDKPTCLQTTDRAEIRSFASLFVCKDVPSPHELRKRLQACDIAVVEWASVPANVFAEQVRVKHIITPTTGYRRIDVKAANNAGVTVSNTPDYCRQAVAEHAFALLLDAAKDIGGAKKMMVYNENADYTSLPPRRELFGRCLGIVGLGSIGAWVAKIALGFGMEVLAYNRSRIRMPDVEQVSLSSLARRSDFLICCTAVRVENRAVLDRPFLEQLRPGAIIVSVSGHGAFDREALCGLLRSGHLSAVLIDRQPDEKLPHQDRLTQTPDVGWYTSEALERNTRLVINTIRSGVEGEPIHVVGRASPSSREPAKDS